MTCKLTDFHGSRWQCHSAVVTTLGFTPARINAQYLKKCLETKADKTTRIQQVYRSRLVLGRYQVEISTALPLFIRCIVFSFILNSLVDAEPPTLINPYPTAFPYGNGMVLHFYQQQESSTTKTVHKVINKGLKTYV